MSNFPSNLFVCNQHNIIKIILNKFSKPQPSHLKTFLYTLIMQSTIFHFSCVAMLQVTIPNNFSYIVSSYRWISNHYFSTRFPYWSEFLFVSIAFFCHAFPHFHWRFDRVYIMSVFSYCRRKFEHLVVHIDVKRRKM